MEAFVAVLEGAVTISGVVELEFELVELEPAVFEEEAKVGLEVPELGSLVELVAAVVELGAAMGVEREPTPALAGPSAVDTEEGDGADCTTLPPHPAADSSRSRAVVARNQFRTLHLA